MALFEILLLATASYYVGMTWRIAWSQSAGQGTKPSPPVYLRIPLTLIYPFLFPLDVVLLHRYRKRLQAETRDVIAAQQNLRENGKVVVVHNLEGFKNLVGCKSVMDTVIRFEFDPESEDNAFLNLKETLVVRCQRCCIDLSEVVITTDQSPAMYFEGEANELCNAIFAYPKEMPESFWTALHTPSKNNIGIAKVLLSKSNLHNRIQNVQVFPFNPPSTM